MPADSCRGIHRGNDLNSLEVNELQVLIIEAFIANYLLEEGNQLDSVILVRLWKIDVFQVDDKPLTVFGPIDSALRDG